MPVAANSNGWSREGSGPAGCVFGARAAALRSALMSTFITELWPCAVLSCPLLSQSCGHAQCSHVHFYHRAVAMRSALMSTFITEL